MNQNVLFLAFDNALSSSLSLPQEMLSAANDLARARRRPIIPFATVTPSGDAVTLQNGQTILGEKIADQEQPNLVYIPTCWRSPAPMINQLRDSFDTFNRWHANGTRFCAVSTGTYVLAEAGLLDGQPATTHWHFFDHFEQRYPFVKLKKSYFVTGGQGVYCAGSVNALADLTVHLIGEAMGQQAAQWVQRNFSHEIRRPFHEIAYIEGRSGHTDEEIAHAQFLMRQHSAHADALQKAVEAAGMTNRTFTRRFRSATGVTPNQYLQLCRIEQAQQLLRQSNLTIGDISFSVGYQDVSFFARLFRRQLGITPSEYRKTVRAKLFFDN